MQAENLKNLNILLAAMSADHLGKKDFTQSFQLVIDYIKKIEQKNIQEFEALRTLVDTLANKLKESNNTEIGSLKDEVNRLVSEAIKNSQAKIMEMDNKMMMVKDGKDADEEKIVEDVLARIKLPEQKEVILDDAFEIRNKLETLNGEERLSIEAIADLKDILEELKNKKETKSVGGGGFSKMAMDIHIIDDETPTNTGNNLSFTINGAPNPISSLKVYRNGQRLKTTTDYTLSGKTITLLSELDPDNELLSVDYRI